MVLTQLELCVESEIILKSFHTTMVLTQRGVEMTTKERIIEFPYHYGSHATHFHRRRDGRCLVFPYHYGSHATEYIVLNTIVKYRGFHTTMVLTQQTISEQLLF